MGYREEQAARHAMASAYARAGDEAGRDKMIDAIERASREERDGLVFWLKMWGIPAAAIVAVLLALDLLGVANTIGP